MHANIETVVKEIIETNRRISAFWRDAGGWAPIEAAELLSKSRLDWQVELSESLRLWIGTPNALAPNAHLILGWANLGALVEGTMKWFLSVFYSDYQADIHAFVRKGDLVPPDEQTLEPLRQFFQKRIWTASDEWSDWVLKIQQRRNAIHAFKSRDLGDHKELNDDIIRYSNFLSELHNCVPYPDSY